MKYCQNLFSLARQQNELIPDSLTFEVNIFQQMIELSADGRPPFFMGVSCGENEQIDKLFAESLALDLHHYLKSR